MKAALSRLVATLCLSLGGLVFFACGESDGPRSRNDGSETHFLRACADDCPTGTDCICGVCTKSCGVTASCAPLDVAAACVAVAPRVAAGACESAEAIAICDVGCLTDGDCAELGDDYACQRGYCRPPDALVPEPGPLDCERSMLVGRDVVVIGDALIELSVFTEDLEALAVADGVLAQGQHFRDYASSLNSILTTGSFAIASQWTAARAEGAARVVVMDGGATDFLNLPCGDDPDPDCPAFAAAVAGAEELFAAYAAASVEDVVYFFYADPPNNPALKASLDLLRPLIENACGRSPVACHFVDLRPSFAGHPEYVNADVVFLEPGAGVAADVVWAVMQDRCVGR